jgi:hypothetical protein
MMHRATECFNVYWIALGKYTVKPVEPGLPNEASWKQRGPHDVSSLCAAGRLMQLFGIPPPSAIAKINVAVSRNDERGLAAAFCKDSTGN